MERKGAAGQPFWLLQQHDNFQVVESREAPSVKVEPGERMKQVFGPFAKRSEAEATMKTMEGRTLRAKREGR